MDLFKNKKFKYGTLGVAFTAAVIALIVIVNIIFSALASNFSWYFDMTSENLYNLSDATKNYLDGIDGTYNDLTIYFFADADKLTQAASSLNIAGARTLWGMKYIYSLAKELDERYDFIKVGHIDLTKDPDKVKQIIGEEYFNSLKLAGYYILIDNYTVERDTDGNMITGADGNPVYRHDFRLFGRDSFYAFNYGGSSTTVDAFKGDYRFAASIMALCSENLPTAYLISGHGEKIGPYTVGQQNVDYGNAQYFCQLLIDCGFRIKKIDLQHEDFEKQKNAVAIIYSPQTDYSSNTGVESHNELGKLSGFLSERGHSLMVLFDYGAQSLPGLEGFLKENCGITVENAQLKDSGENSVDIPMQQIVGKLNTDGEGAGAELAKRISDAGISGKIVFPSARPLMIESGKGTGAICLVPSTTYGMSDGEKKEYSEGSAALATLTRTVTGSYIFCIGTSYATDVYFADNAYYADREMFIGALDMMSEEDAPFNVEYRIIKGEGLDLTKSQATAAMVIISAAIPVAVLLTGTVVFIRRRHS